MTGIIYTGGIKTTFSYNTVGQRTGLWHGNGTRTSSSYDAAGQTTQIIHRKTNGTSILQLDYQYDAAGNRTVMNEDSGTARVTWLYDAQNQLTGENRTGTNAYRQTYTYDSAGNRTVKNVAGTRTTSSYDAANQLTYALAAAGRTTYTFDLAGNQQLELTPAGARTTTIWNYENQPAAYQLPAGSRVTMSYNADNRRVEKQTAATTSTKFVWEPSTDAYFAELDNANATQKIYTFEPVQYGNLISHRVSANSYIHADALGSTRAVTSGGNTVSDTFLYDAWGIEVARTGTTAILPFRWVGGVGYYYDTETGLVYVRARVYQPTTARWVSVDPLILADGVNVFAYAYNNPIFYMDSSGLEGVCGNLGYPMFYADIVAKSFINGVPTIGTLNVPSNFNGIPWPKSIFPFDPFRDHYPGSGADAGTARLTLFLRFIKSTRLAAWFQNPTTDVKDGLYRLYTRAKMQILLLWR